MAAPDMLWRPSPAWIEAATLTRYQRWLERIPAEALFQGAEKQIVRRGQAGFEEIAEEFEELA